MDSNYNQLYLLHTDFIHTSHILSKLIYLSYIFSLFEIPGQSLSLHVSTLVSEPVHVPPLDSTTILTRVPFWVPVPQV